MKETSKKMLDYLMKDFERRQKEKQISSNMRKNITVNYEELGNEFDEEVLSILSACYNAEISDSRDSSATIISFNAMCIAALSCIVSIVNLVYPLKASMDHVLNIVVVITMVVYCCLLGILIYANSKKIRTMSMENAKMRDNIIAIYLRLADKKSEKEQVEEQKENI